MIKTHVKPLGRQETKRARPFRFQNKGPRSGVLADAMAVRLKMPPERDGYL